MLVLDWVVSYDRGKTCNRWTTFDLVLQLGGPVLAALGISLLVPTPRRKHLLLLILGCLGAVLVTFVIELMLLLSADQAGLCGNF